MILMMTIAVPDDVVGIVALCQMNCYDGDDDHQCVYNHGGIDEVWMKPNLLLFVGVVDVVIVSDLLLVLHGDYDDLIDDVGDNDYYDAQNQSALEPYLSSLEMPIIQIRSIDT